MAINLNLARSADRHTDIYIYTYNTFTRRDVAVVRNTMYRVQQQTMKNVIKWTCLVCKLM